mgnify:FL=1
MKFKLKDPGSAITHFIGMLMAMFAATPLILRAMRAPDTVHVISLSIFIVSMILLYAASTTYHTFDKSKKVNTILKKRRSESYVRRSHKNSSNSVKS